jgi:glyoxylase-like metal-dependent hydrolase (beta-lactamase superfamily II)
MSNGSGGGISVEAIVEFEAPFLPIREMLPALTAGMLEESRSWISPRMLDGEDMGRLVFQSFVVRIAGLIIMVDSCVGNDKHHHRPLFNMRRGDMYMRALKAADLTPDDIDIVMCTHMHADHAGWNTRLDGGRWVPTFPNAKYVFGRDELEHWAAAHAQKPEPVYAESVLPIVEAGRAQVVDYDFQIADSVRLIPTPGHTPGHFSVAFGKQHDEVLIAGDLLHSPLQLRYPELSFAFDYDQTESARSRRKLLETYSEQPTLCCFAHFPMALNGRLARWGDGFRCEPLSQSDA